ncbi:MAG: ribonuclease activity regulator RraA [Streptosporangiaceae bacterium]|jgi:regulator of RNase E activity RraA
MKLSPESWRQLHEVSTASLTSELLKLGFRNTFMAGVRPLRADVRLVGYAFTLRYIPAREDLDFQVEYDNWTNPQRVAVETIGPDQVLVIDARGQTGAASLGHILCTRLMARGAAGLVTDGALRDSPAIAGLAFPSYAGGAHATTSSVLHHPADFGLPIGCGGVMVQPGDVMVGDGEGVVVIPAEVAEDVAARCYERDRLEAWLQRRVAGGASIRGTYPPDEETLAEYGAGPGGDPPEPPACAPRPRGGTSPAHRPLTGPEGPDSLGRLRSPHRSCAGPAPLLPRSVTQSRQERWEDRQPSCFTCSRWSPSWSAWTSCSSGTCSGSG